MQNFGYAIDVLLSCKSALLLPQISSVTLQICFVIHQIYFVIHLMCFVIVQTCFVIVQTCFLTHPITAVIVQICFHNSPNNFRNTPNIFRHTPNNFRNSRKHPPNRALPFWLFHIEQATWYRLLIRKRRVRESMDHATFHGQVILCLPFRW
jgi:hypothetical protein